MKKQKRNSGITLVALVISIIVMLILAGVSLNATIGENGIVSRAQEANMKNILAQLEEFFGQKYIESLDKEGANTLSKIELLQKYYAEYFYLPKDYGIGNLNYIVNNDGKALYIIKKSGLPKELQDIMQGGDDTGKTYIDFQTLNDVYGITSDLKVYYSQYDGSELVALSNIELDNDDGERKVFEASEPNGFYEALKKYDKNGDNILTAEEVKSVRELTIGEDSTLTSLEQLYNLVALEKLTIENKKLSNLQGIQNCSYLYYIFFKNSVIEDYTAMSNIGKNLRYLYFYCIDDEELNKICDGIQNGKYTSLENFAVTGNKYYIDANQYNDALDDNSVKSEKSSKYITTLSPLVKLSNETKKAIKYMSINNNAIADENLSYISDFTNIVLLRAEYNSIKSLSRLRKNE